MTLEEHCNKTKQLFGKEFKEVHLWLDEFWGTAGNEGFLHRRHRHHKEAFKDIERLFGEIGLNVAKQHIMDDCGGIPENSKDCKDYEFKRWIESLDE